MQVLTKMEKFGDAGLLALRIAIAMIFIVHGYAKWSVWGMSPSDQMPGGMLAILKLLSVAEPLGGLAVLIGFLTRPATIGLMLPMLGAITMKMTMWQTGFMAQQTTGWEFDFLILCGLICLMTVGPGKLSLDRPSENAS